jgi:hydrogenase 3 maturation protease
MVVLGVGNDLKGDDAVGVWIAEHIKGACNSINGATVPEAMMPEIVAHAPDTVLIVDAARMGRAPGSLGVFTGDEIEKIFFSTHSMPLSVLARILEERLGCDVYIIGIEPYSFEFGAELSPSVRETAESFIELFRCEQ